MPSLRQQLLELIDRLAPEMERAFLEAVEDIKSEIVLREIVERLERRDIEGAIAALHIDEAAFRPLAEALRQAYNAGGIMVVKDMPRLSDPLGGRVVLRWDVSNQRAEANIRELSSKLIVGVNEDTKEMARQTIASGYAQGQGPLTIAYDLAGRVNRITKKREGGFIGLNTGLAATVRKAEIAMRSGDIDGMRAYLTLTKRDKRYDRSVRKAIEAGRPVPAEDVAKIIARLRDSYLKFRAERISRTETLTSVMAAKHEAYQQGLDAAGRDASLVTRKWRSAGDRRVRHTHMVMNGQVVQGMDLAFQSPSGAMLRYPGDTSLGAGAEEIIGCRCDVEYNYDFAEAYARSRGR